MMSPQQLDPALPALCGRHLIEASAGTGKTYNITRLYIRLLLERQLPVQQILVMTFTKAATEELRGRIDRELRHAAAHWGQLGQHEPFFAVLEQRYAAAQAVPLLQQALLHLDEAAIFTIHGFCARVLKQHALASALPMELEMEADTSEQALEAVRDWLRSVAHSELYARLCEQGWHTPEGFMQQFGSAIRSRAELLAAEPQQLLRDALAEKRAVREQLLQHEAALVERLIERHKDGAKRQQEWELLLNWLGSDAVEAPPQAAMAFVNGNRYRGQSDIGAWLAPFKALKEQLPALAEAAQQAAIYPLLKEAIEGIRQRFAASKTQLGVMDFDDLIALLAERIAAADGAALVSALRRQYPAALVDEFQDTDPQQYAMLERIYRPRSEQEGADDATALFMIGDPKQAIYAFRGGDIFTYLRARGDAEQQWQMDTNWRSVPAMVRGYNRLFWGAPLTQPAAAVFGFGIGYEPVKAAKANQGAITRLHAADPPGEPARAALNYVWLTPEDYQAGEEVNADFRHAMARWCCAEIDRLLQQPARLGKTPETGRALEERDIAVLVRSGTEAAIVQQALAESGYPSVYLSARDNLFDSPEAAQLSLALRGILAPEDARALLAASATTLLGGDAARLALLNSSADALVETRYRLMALREQWLREGFIPMMMALIHDWLAPPPERHERCLTNYIHLAELLQQASGNLRHPQQLLEWLEDQRQAGRADAQAELRLESDANLIRIVTQHGSKGLEYPLVLVPFANYPREPLKLGNRKAELLNYHDPDSGDARLLLGRTPAAAALAAEEALAESVRLLYVAVTRAEQRCYLCCGPFKNPQWSPLGRALGLGRPGDDAPQWPEALAALAASEPTASALLPLPLGDTPAPSGSAPRAPQAAGEPARFTGQIEREWRLSSFSALTRNLGHGRRDRKDHDDDRGDERGDSGAQGTELPLRFRLAKGAQAGNLLHDVLEHTDFSAPRWADNLREPLLRFGQLEARDEPALQQWLQQCLDSELPAIGGGSALRLAELSWPLTLREAEFYFPLAGLNLDRLAALLRRHRQSDRAVELPGQPRLRGMMHGFIDLIFEHQGRFYVADYKSTHLGNRLSDYGYAALAANNREHLYDLQYLIYAVALHRYLRDRLADYDPALHFGGVYYLYLRGMQPGSASGVFHTALEPELLAQLDRLFAQSGKEERR